jgi:hypothetical protein
LSSLAPFGRRAALANPQAQEAMTRPNRNATGRLRQQTGPGQVRQFLEIHFQSSCH